MSLMPLGAFKTGYGPYFRNGTEVCVFGGQEIELEAGKSL